jgi:hypothetical protein
MAKKSRFGVTELLKQNKIKRPGRHSKTHKGKKEIGTRTGLSEIIQLE